MRRRRSVRNEQADRRNIPGNGRLWGGLFLPVFAWGFQLFASYGFIEWYCQNRHALREQTALLLLHATAVLALLMCGAGIWLSWRNWQWLRGSSPSASAGRGQFMAVSGLILGGSMIAVILVQALPNLVIPPCA